MKLNKNHYGKIELMVKADEEENGGCVEKKSEVVQNGIKFVHFPCTFLLALLVAGEQKKKPLFYYFTFMLNYPSLEMTISMAHSCS